jgi:hypothetical protein
LEQVGLFDSSLSHAEDREIGLRVVARFAGIRVDSPCWWYRHHPNQASLQAERMYRGYRQALLKFFQNHPEHARLQALAYSYLYMDTALAYLDEANRAKALWFTLRSLARWPGPLGDPLMQTRVPRLKMLLRALIGDPLLRKLRKK